MQCFHAAVNRVKTRFPKESEVMNRDTDCSFCFRFADPANVGKSLLDGNKDCTIARQAGTVDGPKAVPTPTTSGTRSEGLQWITDRVTTPQENIDLFDCVRVVAVVESDVKDVQCLLS